MNIPKDAVFSVTPIESGRPLQDSAASFVAEIYNARHRGELFGMPYQAPGFVKVQDEREVSAPVVATAVLLSVLSDVYLAGRGDQIADIEGTNTRRTVRARNLASVVRQANAFVPIEEHRVPRDIQDFFAGYRGILKDSVIVHPFGEDSDTIMSTQSIPDAEIIDSLVKTHVPDKGDTLESLPKSDRDVIEADDLVTTAAITDALEEAAKRLGSGEGYFFDRDQLLGLVAWAAHVGSESRSTYGVYSAELRRSLAGIVADGIETDSLVKTQHLPSEEGEQ